MSSDENLKGEDDRDGFFYTRQFFSCSENVEHVEMSLLPSSLNFSTSFSKIVEICCTLDNVETPSRSFVARRRKLAHLSGWGRSISRASPNRNLHSLFAHTFRRTSRRKKKRAAVWILLVAGSEMRWPPHTSADRAERVFDRSRCELLRPLSLFRGRPPPRSKCDG